ncbi:MAG: hypothetical protein PSV36_17480 [Algoriphagus sp.]|nr:hypothetical protein [Algoriphagus sp.]
MYVDFNKMPAYSRVWIYQAGRSFSQAEKELVTHRMKTFCDGWNTHGNGMPSSFQILDDQVLILAVDESNLGASGCSIDSSVKALRELENTLGINLTDQGKVSYKSADGGLKVAPALGIKSKVIEGEIGADTLVINPLIQRKSELEDVWISAGKSWLNKYFPN